MTSALFRQIVGDLRDPTSFVGRESSPVRPMFAVRQHSLLQWKTLAGRQRRLNFQSSAVVWWQWHPYERLSHMLRTHLDDTTAVIYVTSRQFYLRLSVNAQLRKSHLPFAPLLYNDYPDKRSACGHCRLIHEIETGVLAAAGAKKTEVTRVDTIFSNTLDTLVSSNNSARTHTVPFRLFRKKQYTKTGAKFAHFKTLHLALEDFSAAGAQTRRDVVVPSCTDGGAISVRGGWKIGREDACCTMLALLQLKLHCWSVRLLARTPLVVTRLTAVDLVVGIAGHPSINCLTRTSGSHFYVTLLIHLLFFSLILSLFLLTFLLLLNALFLTAPATLIVFLK